MKIFSVRRRWIIMEQRGVAGSHGKNCGTMVLDRKGLYSANVSVGKSNRKMREQILV
jgi:hypothetical protein